MYQRQVVVITGKTCSGKTGLADLLAEEFQFRVVRSEEVILGGASEKSSTKNFSSPKGKVQDEVSSWMAKATRAVIDSLVADSPVVVDHLRSPQQVLEFRKLFGENLVHVHLYASQETLRSRYSEGNGKLDGAPPYEEVDHLTDDDHVRDLRDDADVRINTSRSDARDTLVRVAARLHLYTAPETGSVDVLIGGQYGSEGKGNVVSFLAREYDVMVRVGGPNAGHTVASLQGPYTYHHLPSGSRDVAARLLLGPGMTIRVQSLLKEIADCNITPDRLFIDPQATIIEDEDVQKESESLVSVIASTGSGSGAASARRILSRGNIGIRLAKDVPELAPYVGSKGNYHGTTADRLEEAYRKGQSILLEGTQGSGLSVFHGSYPHVTSRDTNVAGCLAEAGISPRRVRKILMVVRPMPIRVGDPDGNNGYTSGPLKHSTTFDDIAQEAGLNAESLRIAEKTSTTKRNRRVGWFEWDQFRKACALNAPTDIVLTFADYLSASNSSARRFDALTSDTIRFVEELERVSQAPVSLINTRFQREDDGTGDLRSIIDRRNWTARRQRN